MTRLILVGTVHTDPHGYRRSLRLLERLQPQSILVELSPFGLSFRQTRQGVLWTTLQRNLRQAAVKSAQPLRQVLSHPQIRAVSRQLSLPFEYRAAAKFVRRSRARLVLVDDSRFSRHWIATWPELIATENLLHLLSLPRTGPSVSTAYAHAARRIAAAEPSSRLPPAGRSDPEQHLWEVRERFLAARIARVMQEQKPDSAVYLGGWQHLTQDGTFPTLRRLLQVPRERCVLLREAQESAEDSGGERRGARGWRPIVS